MSKYFDRLIQINESLDKKIGGESCSESSMYGGDRRFDIAIRDGVKNGYSEGDSLVWAFHNYMMENPEYENKSIDDISLAEFSHWLVEKPDEMVSEDDGNDGTVPVPVDTVTDDQKKEILSDKGMDKKVLDGMTPEEMDGALKAVDDENIKSESRCIVKMNDEDLGKTGYLVKESEKDVVLSERKSEACGFATVKDAKDRIMKICESMNYDPSSFKVVRLKGKRK